MKSQKVQGGMLVVCNNLRDAVIYVVEEINGFMVGVKELGTTSKIEWIDCCFLRPANDKQIKRAEKQMVDRLKQTPTERKEN